MKFNKAIIYISILFLGFQVSFTQEEESLYYKINKSFETFGSIFREIANNYVVEIDPEELMLFGVQGMLTSLDPYTEYYSEEDTEDIDIITSGSYTGVGITVSIRDNMLTIVSIQDGYSAKRNGIRVGDRIVKVDSTIILNESSEVLRKYTRGKVGTPITFYILRDGIIDTLKYELKREEIRMKNVSYSGTVKDSVGYIKLERFTRTSADEVRQAYFELKDKYKINALIIDLRDNPGGLLEAAVDICQLFVPYKSKIVSTKGRNNQELNTYYSEEEPIDSLIPIAILINNGSASASEIVAGAMQDLDRAIIIGQRSFGKGLVQSIYDMPYNGNLKMTTAKYYTPSGRCIQKIDYYIKYKKTNTNPDTVFYTKNNRKVLESKGIIPDTTVEKEVYPEFIYQLLQNNKIFNFANTYSSKYEELPANFKADSNLLNDFNDYLISVDFSFKTELQEQFDKLQQIAIKEKYSKKTIESIETAKLKIASEEKELLKKYPTAILKLLEKEIRLRFISDREAIEIGLNSDYDISTALSLFATSKYSKMISGE